MLGLVVKGFIIGILVSAPLGPVGMLCIQRTLSEGRRHGFISGMGAVLSDVIYAAITGLFMGLVVDFVELHQQLLQLFGSIVIGFFGYYIFRSNPVKNLMKDKGTKLSLVQNFVTAFLFTFSNVLIILLFIGLYAHFTFVFPSSSAWDILYRLGSIAFGAVTWWFVLTYLISKLRKWFNIRSIHLLNRIVGGVIIFLGIIGIVDSII
jgi:threonine/homoserine/homoserine lactone efflux protein